MTDDTCSVAICDRPVSESEFVCPACISDLRQVLAEVPWLVDELNLVISRQTKFTTGGIAVRSSEIPLPVDLHAADILADLAGKLSTWTRLLLEENPGWRAPTDDPKRTSAWLLARLSTIAAHAAGGDLVEELCAASAAGRWRVDRPADKWYAGVCSAEIAQDGQNGGQERVSDSSGTDGPPRCSQDLYAAVSEGIITCRRCGTQHDVAKRREILLEAAEDVLATATEAARAITVWSDYERGESRLVKRIGMWVERKRLTPRGERKERGRMRPTYRIGDILDLIAPEDSQSERGA